MVPLEKLQLKVLQNAQVITQVNVSEYGVYHVGRSEACHITINSNVISGCHLTISLCEQGLTVRDNASSNGSTINSNTMIAHQEYNLTSPTTVSLAHGEFAVEIIPINDVKIVESVVKPITQNEVSKDINLFDLLKARKEIIIGRSSDCDYVLTSLQVSRKHTLLQWEDDKIFLQDLDTTNGTFVNGVPVRQRVVIQSTDQITIGTTTFALQSGLVELKYAIVADNIQKVYAKGVIGLNKMSLKIPSQQFIALMGPSGCGKSTLLKGLNGANPVTSGAITIQGLSLNNENYNTLKKYIGYVPQDDIVHGDLSVEKTLYYAAKLRMSDDVSKKEISAKIDQVLTNLNLDSTSIRKNKINELSGGQRKRISIAVELLNDPKILFLDEPTSPLDPETIEDFLSCIRQLVHKGQTVIMVTHKPSDLDYVDQVIFLSKGGYQTYFGEKEGLLTHFSKDNIIEIYSMMKSPSQGKDWNDYWLKKYPTEAAEVEQQALELKENTSLIKQYFWLSARYFNIKINDGWNLALLLAQPIIIAGLLVFIFGHLQVSVMFMMAISAVWFGVSNAAKEIVSELPIYERERMYNLSIINYIASKLTVLSVVAFVQVIIFVSIINVNYQGDDSQVQFWDIPDTILFMFLLSVSATLFGLFLSAVFSNTEKVMTFVPIALMPQIMLAGVIAPLDNSLKIVLSCFTLGRWGTEGFAHLQDNAAREQGNWANKEIDLPASVMQWQPVLSNSGGGANPPTSDNGMELVPQGAMNQLGLYSDDGSTLSVFPESILGVFIAISLINMLCLIGLYAALKSKDKRFV